MPGSIVNVSSIASVIAAEKFMVYCGTKACMDAFTRNMAGELGRHQVCERFLINFFIEMF